MATETKIFDNFKGFVGAEAMNELFAQFFVRIYKEIPDSILASFSTPKFITSEKFAKFRQYFCAEYQKGFICKSDTFDNVQGKFPIGFFIWNLAEKSEITHIEANIFLNNKEIKQSWEEGNKTFYVMDNKSITDWRAKLYDLKNDPIGYMIIVGPSMQSNNNTFITSSPAESYVNKGMVANITQNNLIGMCVYLSIRHCTELTWINNKDQFLYPNKDWEKDKEFQHDCLAYTLFHGQNKITASDGKNHWLPFTEQEVEPNGTFISNFMTDFIKGKIRTDADKSLFQTNEKAKPVPLQFSPEAQAVFMAGKALWSYYHKNIKNQNSFVITYTDASLYDIRAYFQGRNAQGKMNNRSEDETYNELITTLREKLKILAQKIEPKVYEYGFLKK